MMLSVIVFSIQQELIKISDLYSRLLTKLHTIILSNSFNYIGRGTIIYHRSKIINKVIGGVSIGNFCLIGRSHYQYHAGMPFYTTILNDGQNSRVNIGDNCRINGAYIHAQDFIKIGNNCVFASGISIIDSNAHQVKSTNRTIGRDTPQGIVIGNNVWIGLNAIILKGTVIGDNSIVSAGSVVQGYFEENSIIRGNPATNVGSIDILS